MQCKSFCNTIPPFFVLVIIAWSYYSYIVVFCLNFTTAITKKFTYILLFHVFLLLFMWCYLHTIFKHHKPVPEEYRLTSEDHVRLLSFEEDQQDELLKKIIAARRLDIHCAGNNGKRRYCKTCMFIKPDRTHHCSICERCILKMDHHCPWIANCVGYSNYKQFLLMLFYGTILCLFYIGTAAEYFAVVFEGFDKYFHCMVVGIGFAVAVLVAGLLMILLGYHLSMVCNNETTLESLYGVTFLEDNVTFNIGKWYNFTDVFGDNICCWLLPTQSHKGNGHEFQFTNLIPLGQK